MHSGKLECHCPNANSLSVYVNHVEKQPIPIVYVSANICFQIPDGESKFNKILGFRRSFKRWFRLEILMKNTEKHVFYV